MEQKPPPHPTATTRKGLDLVDLTEEAAFAASEPLAPPPLIATPKPLSQQIAVAIKYEAASKEAPKIVATGRGAIAEQILQLAFANNVNVREDADLVELLSHLEINTPIPLEAYAAVAEILAYVYRANHRYGQPSPL
jgi:flagellar biosynthesis protein